MKHLLLLHGAIGAMDQMQPIATALADQDAVIFAVGTDLGQTNLRHTAMNNIISAMQQNHVKRIIGIGGMGILQASEDKKIFENSFSQINMSMPVEFCFWDIIKEDFRWKFMGVKFKFDDLPLEI